MPYPSITSYLEAIHLPDSFKDLVGIEPMLNSNNEPIIIAGGNAVVFKMRYNGKQVAIKCFTNESEERTMRYAAISSYLQQNPSPYFVTFRYYETELFIDGEEYPLVFMDWIEGKTLGTSMLEAYRAKDTNFLRFQASKLLDMFLFLLHQPVAHGDLKHENILVKENGDLVLVDYDGMYIPSLAGKESSELGSKGYQHPDRNSSWFDADLDNFSMLVLMLTHLYLAELPDNCTPDSRGQLFTEADYISIGNGQINACFQFKICRQWAVYLFDVCEENSLLKGTNDFFRTVHTQMNDLMIKANEAIESNAKGNQLIIDEYLEKGLRYKNGEGVNKDFSKTMEFYLKAADLGNSDAMFRVGVLYSNGQGVVKDNVIAIKWYNKAIDLGNVNAMRTLGSIYINGKCVKENYGEAMELFIKAAELGDSIAMNLIGSLYANSIVVAMDIRKALYWYKKAAELGNTRAMFNIGSLYRFGSGLQMDFSEAMKWYKKAAELGDTIAMYLIGVFYQNGEGVAQDYSEAIKWFIEAESLGSTRAMNKLGDFYKNGLGVTIDINLAQDWYKKAKYTYEYKLKGYQYVY